MPPAQNRHFPPRIREVGLGWSHACPLRNLLRKLTEPAEVVKEKSGGKIKLSPGGVLGGDVQTVSALQGSTIEMAMIGPSQGRRMKDFGPIYRNQISI